MRFEVVVCIPCLCCFETSLVFKFNEGSNALIKVDFPTPECPENMVVLSFINAFTSSMLIFFVATLIIFLTEITSNVATTSTFLPVFGAVAIGLGILPVSLTVPVCLAASCAFMLPVATPPNAIVYGSGKFTIATMMKAGFLLNIIGIFVVTLFAYFIAPQVF